MTRSEQIKSAYRLAGSNASFGIVLSLNGFHAFPDKSAPSSGSDLETIDKHRHKDAGAFFITEATVLKYGFCTQISIKAIFENCCKTTCCNL